MFWKKKKLNNIEPTQSMIEEAKNNPNGYVYAIKGNYAPSDEVPPEAIAGAWKVDDKGKIIEGSYQENPNFRE